VAEPLKFTRPVVGTRTGFHADQTRRQSGDEFEEFGAWYFGAHEFGLAGFAHAMHGENVLCQVDSNGYDGHDFPSQLS
jgi:hypothetical protein